MNSGPLRWMCSIPFAHFQTASLTNTHRPLDDKVWTTPSKHRQKNSDLRSQHSWGQTIRCETPMTARDALGMKLEKDHSHLASKMKPALQQPLVARNLHFGAAPESAGQHREVFKQITARASARVGFVCFPVRYTDSTTGNLGE